VGDGLAQKLFEALQRAGHQPTPPFRIVTWDELDAASQCYWEQVAITARKHMHEQCAAYLRHELEQVPGYAAHEVAMDLADKWSPLS
jgi:hypothetical protein